MLLFSLIMKEMSIIVSDLFWINIQIFPKLARFFFVIFLRIESIYCKIQIIFKNIMCSFDPFLSRI